jgi:hypothetical protein
MPPVPKPKPPLYSLAGSEQVGDERDCKGVAAGIDRVFEEQRRSLLHKDPAMDLGDLMDQRNGPRYPLQPPLLSRRATKSWRLP